MKLIQKIEQDIDTAIDYYENLVKDPELYYERVDLLNLREIKERLQPILDKKDYSDCEWASQLLDEVMLDSGKE